jgi:hypothetical protein
VNVWRKLPLPVSDPRHGGLFVLILIPTNLYGIHGDPHISNINKIFILFGQNYDNNITLFRVGSGDLAKVIYRSKFLTIISQKK